jgi:rod shape-determining protein MreB and related proteins
MIGLLSGRKLAIDLGNSKTTISDNKQLLTCQPSYVVLNSNNKSLKAVGSAAYDMYGRTHDQFQTVKPLRGGVIADFDSACLMLKAIVNSINNQPKFSLRGIEYLISGIPYSTTEVERRALRDSLEQFHSRKTKLIFEPLAAALGLGLDIKKPDGIMLVDIGGGITECVIISLSGITAFQSIKMAGDSFDEDIRDYFRKQYNMSIGHKTAELIKIHVGAVLDQLDEEPQPYYFNGKDLMTGIPIKRKTDYKEISFILDRTFSRIENHILKTLETCPPELAADLYQNGIHVTGGCALLKGVKKRLEKFLSLKVHIDSSPQLTVSKGISKVLANPDFYKSILID